jgi:hypothetical protein
MRQIDEVNFMQHFWHPEEEDKTNDVWGKDAKSSQKGELLSRLGADAKPFVSNRI